MSKIFGKNTRTIKNSTDGRRNGYYLQDIAASKGLIYGSLATMYWMETVRDVPYYNAFIRECQMIVGSFGIGFDNNCRPTSSSFDFTIGDDRINKYYQMGKLILQHGIMAHDSLPTWFAGEVNAGNAEQYMTDHITTTLGRYVGKIHSSAVWTEVINDGHGTPDANGVRPSDWYTFFGGESYLDVAFHAAFAADPNILLILNQ